MLIVLGRFVTAAFALALTLALAACHLVPERPPAPVLHDLGPVPGGSVALVWRAQVQVSAPPWLDGGEIHYRAGDATRLAAYRDHRWAAPPSQLLARRLEHLLAPPPAAAPVRALEIELADFEQRFAAGGTAQAVLAARATLFERRGGALIASRDFGVTVPCVSADVDGGVAALAAGLGTLASDIGQWLAGAVPP